MTRRWQGIPTLIATDNTAEDFARLLEERAASTGNPRWRHAAHALIAQHQVGAPEIDDTFLITDVQKLVRGGHALDDAIKIVSRRFPNSRAVLRRLRLKFKNIGP